MVFRIKFYYIVYYLNKFLINYYNSQNMSKLYFKYQNASQLILKKLKKKKKIKQKINKLGVMKYLYIYIYIIFDN